MNPPLLRGAAFQRQMILLRKSDKEAVRAAVMPEESPAPPELIADLRKAARHNLKISIPCLLIFLVPMIWGILMRSFITCWCMGFGVVLMMLLICTVFRRLKLRDDATVMRIPIAGVQTRGLICYGYFYLPDGKYRFPHDRNLPQPEALLVIRCGKYTCYQIIGKDVNT